MEFECHFMSIGTRGEDLWGQTSVKVPVGSSSKYRINGEVLSQHSLFKNRKHNIRQVNGFMGIAFLPLVHISLPQANHSCRITATEVEH